VETGDVVDGAIHQFKIKMVAGSTYPFKIEAPREGYMVEKWGVSITNRGR
jgi:hypothetical protein